MNWYFLSISYVPGTRLHATETCHNYHYHFRHHWPAMKSGVAQREGCYCYPHGPIHSLSPQPSKCWQELCGNDEMFANVFPIHLNKIKIHILFCNVFNPTQRSFNIIQGSDSYISLLSMLLCSFIFSSCKGHIGWVLSGWLVDLYYFFFNPIELVSFHWQFNSIYIYWLLVCFDSFLSSYFVF